MDENLFKVFRKRFYNAKDRCNNKNNKRYHAYGGRGIKCLWNSSEEFKNDMYDSFIDHVKIHGIENTTLDRIDNDGNYCKENCKRSTWHEQSKNRRECRQFNYNGMCFKTLTDLAKFTGINEATIRFRLNKGRTIEKAIETAVRDAKIGIDYNGKHYESIQQLCTELGVSRKIVYNRIKSGRSLENAIKKEKVISRISIKYEGKTFNSIKELSKYLNVPYSTLKKRIKKGKILYDNNQ